jgi:hypothetical protein
VEFVLQPTHTQTIDWRATQTALIVLGVIHLAVLALIVMLGIFLAIIGQIYIHLNGSEHDKKTTVMIYSILDGLTIPTYFCCCFWPTPILCFILAAFVFPGQNTYGFTVVGGLAITFGTISMCLYCLLPSIVWLVILLYSNTWKLENPAMIWRLERQSIQSAKNGENTQEKERK